MDRKSIIALKQLREVEFQSMFLFLEPFDRIVAVTSANSQRILGILLSKKNMVSSNQNLYVSQTDAGHS